MTPKTQLGVLSNLYLNTGTYATPTFAPVTLVGDCTVSAPWDEGDASSRASRVKMASKTMLGLAVNAKILASLTDAGYTTILNALASDDVVNVMVLNGAMDVNGVRGWMFDAQVFKGDEDQGTGAVVFTDVDFKPCFTGNPPNHVLVASGAPVMSPV